MSTGGKRRGTPTPPDGGAGESRHEAAPPVGAPGLGAPSRSAPCPDGPSLLEEGSDALLKVFRFSGLPLQLRFQGQLLVQRMVPAGVERLTGRHTTRGDVRRNHPRRDLGVAVASNRRHETERKAESAFATMKAPHPKPECTLKSLASTCSSASWRAEVWPA